jgi:hypothetical protein
MNIDNDNNIQSNNLYISGSIGIKILQNKTLNKKVFIFFDDHSNKNYCNKIISNNDLLKSSSPSSPSLFISELFDGFIDKTTNIALILEEPFIDKDDKIKILWDGSTHLILFRKFYGKLINKCSNEKICNIFPSDIRLCLFDISPDEIIFNLFKPNNNYNIPVIDYMHNIFYLFNLNDKYSVTVLNYNEYSSICIFIKKIFNTYSNSDFYINLKKNIELLICKFIIPNKHLTIYELIKQEFPNNDFKYIQGYPYVNSNNMNYNFIDQLDKISSGIMELYMLILIMLLSKQNLIVYAGYYHSNNLSFILEKYYDFDVVYDVANTNNITENNNPSHNNCIKVDKKYFNLI